jgi:adenosylhomocysteine nucleosidase
MLRLRKPAGQSAERNEPRKTADGNPMNSEVRSPKSEALVCFALNEEAAPFRKFCEDTPEVAVLITGIGRRNAERAIRGFLQSNLPQRVFTCGFAGALNPALKIGDVISFTTDDALRSKLEGLKVSPGKFYCAQRVAVTAAEKSELLRATGADAVEMESEVTHAVCQEHGIPCATVRVISDVANEDLPMDFNALMDDNQSISLSKLSLKLAKSPSLVPRLMKLQLNCRLAANRLADVLAKLVSL